MMNDAGKPFGYYSNAGGSAVSLPFEIAPAQTCRRAEIAGPDEDPNLAPAAYASPPCFLHELDPAYLGYLRQEEVLHFLCRIAAGWQAGIAVIAGLAETIGGEIAAALRAICREDVALCEGLCRHIERYGGTPPGCPPAAAEEEIAAGLRKREALVGEIGALLPRIGDDDLRQDLSALVAMHGRRVTEISVAAALRQLRTG